MVHAGAALSSDLGDARDLRELRERVGILEHERDTVELLLEELPRLVSRDEATGLAERVAALGAELCGAEAAFYLETEENDVEDVGNGFTEAPRPRVAPLLSAVFTSDEALLVEDVVRLARSESAQRPYGTLMGGRLARSWLAVPVCTPGGELHGVIFCCHGAPRAFSGRHARLVSALAGNLAVLWDNERLLEERARVATALQETLLPPLLPEVAGLELASRIRPSGRGNLVGGDFYDVFPVGDGLVDIVLGDVSGGGPEAAAVTGIARYAIRTIAGEKRCPSEVLVSLNDALLAHTGPERFCTACYLRVEAGEPPVKINLSRAGHPPALLVSDEGQVRALGPDSGTLLGLFSDAQLLDETFALEAGDALVLYTDGVIEAPGPDGEQFGMERLVHLLSSSAGRTADGIARRIELAVMDHAQGVLRDDLAVLVLRARARFS
ncbi:MAG: putative sensor protein [Acidimicrobiaceae bacterium]|nr:putative sensor protein [Acidimicrobiaceae bacterium]